jgi:hypothetical protein
MGSPQTPAILEATVNSNPPIRVGVVLCELGELNTTALKYLIVHLNTLQRSIEFEILAADHSDPLLATLAKGVVANRDECRDRLSGFRDRIMSQSQRKISDFDLSDHTVPENFVLISLARFSDGHFGLKAGHVQVQALGNWERAMAPPSILEFIVVLLMRQAASFVAPLASKSLHLGTKGCLFDFTSDLSEARYKALQAFVCTNCRARLRESNAAGLADDLVRVLDFNWLGAKSDPHTPAGIVANLGYDLFLTKGLKPTFWESVRTTLRDEGTKEIIKLIFAVILTALLVRWHLKTP